jgi:hypothetical protein
MFLRGKSEKSVLVWCANGFASVDMWLSVIRKLKEKEGIKIYFVFPEPSTLGLEGKNSGLFNLVKEFSDDIVYRGYSRRWFIAPTLIEARTAINATKFSKIDAKILRLFYRLTKGRASKYIILRVIGKTLSIMYKYFFHIREGFTQQTLYDFKLLGDVDGVLYDVTVEWKLVHTELINELKNVQKFSMRHGLGLSWVADHLKCEESVPKRSDVTVYVKSHLEVGGYKKCYGILEKNIVHASIPRHDKDWIEFVCSQPDASDNEEDVFDSFVFIIGRQISPYHTIARKRKALKDIYNVICVKNKLKLVVKKHPKESLNGIDGDIYRDVLGMDNYGKTWLFSNSHPFILGKKSLFSISFYSGVPLDMLAINKPTIEYLDLVGLKGYDNKKSLRDDHGKAVSQYRYTKLVLGVSSKLELERNVESILTQYDATVLPLRSRYDDFFKTFDDTSEVVAKSEVVANDIYEKIQ